MQWQIYKQSPFDSKSYSDTVISTNGVENGKFYLTYYRARSGGRLLGGLIEDPDNVLLDVGLVESQKEFKQLREQLIKIIEHNDPRKPFENIPPRSKNKAGTSYKTDKVFLGVLEALVTAADERETIVPAKAAKKNNPPPSVKEPTIVPSQENGHMPNAAILLTPVEQEDLEMTSDDFIDLMDKFNFSTPSRFRTGVAYNTDFDLRALIIRPKDPKGSLIHKINFGAYFRNQRLTYSKVLIGAGPSRDNKKTMVILFDNILLATNPDNFSIPQMTYKKVGDVRRMQFDFFSSIMCRKLFLEAGLEASSKLGTNTHLKFDVKPLVIKDAEQEKDKNFYLTNMRREVVDMKEEEKHEQERETA